jgi:hypothetical protein
VDNVDGRLAIGLVNQDRKIVMRKWDVFDGVFSLGLLVFGLRSSISVSLTLGFLFLFE